MQQGECFLLISVNVVLYGPGVMSLVTNIDPNSFFASPILHKLLFIKLNLLLHATRRMFFYFC